ncbi:MAG: hypothetical protein Greene041679_383 [Parcubacteria group bacterium Greene0416_79]|nr:MAG: hypothetical protein Greene041679_383 [Parcubacteria group bacterium Greene0416_79]
MTARIYEAKSFLTRGRNTLAGNRFPNSSEALQFVNTLYDNGATKVTVPNVANFKSEDEMYADTVIVKLPSDTKKRRVLFETYNKELLSEGFEAKDDRGQKEITLWWD